MMWRLNLRKQYCAMGVMAVWISVMFLVVLTQFIFNPQPQYIDVNGDQWLVRGNEAERVIYDGEFWMAGDVAAKFDIYYPNHSYNRTVKIAINITEGTLDLLVFPSFGDYDSWRYGGTFNTTKVWYNSTQINHTVEVSNRSVYIGILGHYGGVYIVGLIVAHCLMHTS